MQSWLDITRSRSMISLWHIQKNLRHLLCFTDVPITNILVKTRCTKEKSEGPTRRKGYYESKLVKEVSLPLDL